MASGDDAVRIVDRADLADCGPMVHDKVEKNSSLWFWKGSKKEEQTERVKSENSTSAPSSEKKDSESSHHKSSNDESCNEGSAPHKEFVHEGEGVKSTYDVEEDVPPSYLEQLKRKMHLHGR